MDFRQFTTEEEAYQLSLALRNAYLRVPLGLELSEEDTAGEKEQLHFGLFEGEALLASVAFKDLGEGCLKLRQMVVDESRRGLGVGRTLVSKAEEQARAMGFREVTMSARAYAKEFYEKLGYEASGESFVEVGIEHVLMSKRLG